MHCMISIHDRRSCSDRLGRMLTNEMNRPFNGWPRNVGFGLQADISGSDANVGSGSIADVKGGPT